MIKLDKHEYGYETIVIGGGLNALLFSYYNNFPCIFVDPCPPFKFDVFDEGIDLSLFGAANSKKEIIWQRLTASLSLGGQLPMSDKIEAISIQDNKLKAITSNSRLGRFEFDKLIIFDDGKIRGLPPIRKQKIGKYRIFDWFHVRSGMEHDHDSLETKDDFIQKVIFYPSDRFGNQTSGRLRKDLVAISYLDSDEVDNFDYSSTMARFKITQMMKEAGIKGARNGKDTNNPSLYRYYSVKVESMEREVFRSIQTFYAEDPRFEFRYDSPVEVIDQFDAPMVLGPLLENIETISK